MSDIRVLQVGKFFPPHVGGMETFLCDLTESVSRKISCDVLCFNSGTETVIEDMGNYRVYKAGVIANINSAQISPAMLNLFRKISGDYDIIHVHMPNPAANLIYYLVRPKAKLMILWQSDIVRQKNLLRVYEPLQNWLLKRASKIIATSPNYIEGSKYLLKYREKCLAVPLGFSPERLKVDPEKVKGIRQKYGSGGPLIFTAGRLVYYKGFEYLIDAMKKVDGCLLIGGKGPLKNKLSSLIQTNRLENKVYLLDEIDHNNIGNYYEACDIFCLPSVEKSEAFALVQAEAMYFKKPVISTLIEGSGVSWVNQDGITGLTIPPKNTDALSESLNRIISDQALCDRFGTGGRDRFEKEFDIKKVSDKMIEIYKEVYDQ